jgi:hypothetical protein
MFAKRDYVVSRAGGSQVEVSAVLVCFSLSQAVYRQLDARPLRTPPGLAVLPE